jgi:hypothetical protein
VLRSVRLLFCLFNAMVIYGSYKQNFYLLFGLLTAMQIVSSLISGSEVLFYEGALNGLSCMMLAQLQLMYATR